MDVKEKYGFFDIDDVFISLDGHCWTMGIDVLNCKREDTGDRIEISNIHYPYKPLKCKAVIYKLVLNEEQLKRSGFSKETELYAAIGEVDDCFLVCTESRSFSEEINRLNAIALKNKQME